MNSPGLEEFDALARQAYASLPAEFRKLCGNVVIHVAEEADAETLRAVGLSRPLELSGLFEGIAIGEARDAPPNHVHLYRRSILAEWRARGDISLEELVTHVLVHEIGHHFGLSDEDMHAIEDQAE
ncbi:metallopeptidase family protein [Hyphococcus sp.]|uniref:metallopeptidase family protein n=1 Tax=Hyphococcus sp. TaxID=2038636 RepID=UPI003CCC2CA9